MFNIFYYELVGFCDILGVTYLINMNNYCEMALLSSPMVKKM